MIVITEYLGTAGYKASCANFTIHQRGSYTSLLDLIDAEMVKLGIHNYGVDHKE